MIERGEQKGLLKPGDTIVETTSGDTGTAHVKEALIRAKELGEPPGCFCRSQFESQWNVEENRQILGSEILASLPSGRVPDAPVLGVGTGATSTGVGQAFRQANPDVGLFAMEPSKSCTILCGEIASHTIEGICDGFVPGIFQRHASLVNDVLSVSSEDAVTVMKRLAREYGLFCGPSSGAHRFAVNHIRKSFLELKAAVAVFCDEGEKYLHEYFMLPANTEVGAPHFA